MTQILLHKVKRIFIMIGSLILFLGSFWYILVYWMLFLNAHLVPWDASGPASRPDPGTRDYILNNFFENGPGFGILFYGLLAILTLLIISRVYWKRESFTSVILNVLAAQTIYLLSAAIVVIITIVFFRNGEYQAGYHPVELLVAFSLLLGYFYLVYRLELVSGKFNSKKKPLST